MRKQDIGLVREQLDASLKKFSPLKKSSPPMKGWVRAIRTALGMSGQQLATRLGVNRQRVSRIEKDEVAGKLTIKTLEKVAEALDCKLVYGFVPRSSLEMTVNQQAEKIASKRMGKVFHTMSLEQQNLSKSAKKKAIERTAKKIITTMPGSIWNLGNHND